MQGSKRIDRKINPKREVTEVCEEGQARTSEVRCTNKIRRKAQSEDHLQDYLRDAIEEIRMINRRPMVGGSFKSLMKSQQRQVNSVHAIRPSKHRRRQSLGMVFSKEDARGVK